MITKHVPNLLTCCNLLSGCAAIIFAFHSTQTFGPMTGQHWVYVMIAAAALFDFLDGASARLLKAYSNIGADLDSLSDLVSFGVAPAMLMINVMLQHQPDVWVAYGALAVPVCGALRLARFNNDSSQTDSFVGLPIPACAIFLIGLCGWIENYIYPGTAITLIITIAIALCMVCNLRMFSLKFHDFAVATNVRRYVLLGASLMFIISFGVAGLAWAVLLYLLMSVFKPHSSN